MTEKPTCCGGLPQHTFTGECLLRGYDVGTLEGRRQLAHRIVQDWWEGGGVLPPGASLVRLEPGEGVLNEEDVRRFLEGDARGDSS